MQTRKDRWQEDLFVASPLRALVPEEHILKRVDHVQDLSWIHAAVHDSYCQNNGRGSIDPECALRLMLAGFFQGIVRDRTLMREAQVNLAIRWFAGYRLDEALPHHGHARALRRGRSHVSIQAYLTAVVMNLKTRVPALTASFWPIYAALKRLWESLRTPQRPYGVSALLAA